jgi:hypothetical protein
VTWRATSGWRYHQEVGIPECTLEELRGGDAAHNAVMLQDALGGAKVGRCGLKPADPPELKAYWLRKWGRPPMDRYSLTLIYDGGPLRTIERLKATCDEAF